MKESNGIINAEKYEELKLENQICFPLYASANAIIRKYKTYLEPINLTYTQYITMMVLWEKKKINVKELGKCIYLDSGTLTPLLKKLEEKGYIERHRSDKDERNLIVSITKQGEELKKKAMNIPKEMCKDINISKEEAQILYKILYKILAE